MCRRVNKVILARIPDLRARWIETETSPKAKVSNLELKIFFPSFGALLPRRRTTHYRLMMLDVLFLKVLQHEVGVIIFQIVKQNWEKEIFFVVLFPVLTIFTFFSPLFWALVENYIFDVPETGIRHLRDPNDAL